MYKHSSVFIHKTLRERRADKLEYGPGMAAAFAFVGRVLAVPFACHPYPQTSQVDGLEKYFDGSHFESGQLLRALVDCTRVQFVIQPSPFGGICVMTRFFHRSTKEPFSSLKCLFEGKTGNWAVVTSGAHY